MSSSSTRLGVLGSPIEHSKSPVLHSAAYARLGLNWNYGRFEVDEAALASFLASRGEGWRGMSLTMPLKTVVIPMCRAISEAAHLAGAVNTIVFDSPDGGAAFSGHNTDIEGIRLALDEAGAGIETVHVLGAGATASSVVVASALRGAKVLTVRARRAEQAAETLELARRLGLEARALPIDARFDEPADVVVNTIPGGHELRFDVPESFRAASTLLDVIYDPWPTALASTWLEAGGSVVSGLDMLVHQAVAQVRLFVRESDRPAEVSDRDLVLAMRVALGR